MTDDHAAAPEADPDAPAGKFSIFRFANAGPMHRSALDDKPQTVREGLARLPMVSDGAVGFQGKCLFDIPGLSLTQGWFKSGFPLPLHAHDSDCLYYVIAGSMRVGTEELGPGDGFFVPRNVAYTHSPGDEGVEILEIRLADYLQTTYVSKSPETWEKIGQEMRSRKQRWADEPRPRYDADRKPWSNDNDNH
jgi:mannose-6-phosphate isomerase-like protein (cupin superfamily)